MPLQNCTCNTLIWNPSSECALVVTYSWISRQGKFNFRLIKVLLRRGFNVHYRRTWLVHILIFPSEESQNFTPLMGSTNIGACCVEGTKKISWSSPPVPYFSRTVSTYLLKTTVNLMSSSMIVELDVQFIELDISSAIGSRTRIGIGARDTWLELGSPDTKSDPTWK